MQDADFLSEADPGTIAVIVLFGCITFATVAMAARTWLLGDNRALLTAMTISERTKIVPPLEKNFVSVFVFLYHATLLGMVLFSAYILEHHPPFPHAERAAFDADYLVFLLLLVIGYSFFTTQRNDGSPKKEIFSKPLDRGSDMVSVRSTGSARSAGSGLRTVKSNGNRSGRSDNLSRRSNKSDSSRRSNRSENSSHASSVEEIDWQQDQKSVGSDTGLSHSSMLSTTYEDASEGAEDDASTFLSSIVSESIKTTSTGTSRQSRASQQSTDSQNRKLEEVRLDDETYTLTTKHSSKHPKRPRHEQLSTATGDSALLNVEQTLEWKGVLSMGFLVYKLTGADLYPIERNLFYNAAQVGSFCFVFLTGFGHTMYFYSRNDYRFTRVLQVFFRINMTAVWLCLTLGNRYIFYYACPLHSMAFLLTYGTMRMSRALNYSKFGLRMKLCGLAALTLTIWDLNFGLFKVLFLPLFTSTPSVRGAPNGPLYEWYYQTHVHHWAPFVGMVYAVNYPISNLVLAKMERNGDVQNVILTKGVVCAGLVVALALWISGPFTTTKFTFDSTHPYFGFLPLLSYIYFRNLTQSIRDHHMALMRAVGSRSMELFLLHHHFFLCDGGTAMLVLLPGYPKCNVILTGALLLFVADLVRKFTRVILAMALPLEDESKSVKCLIVSASCSVALYGSAFLLQSMGMVSMGSVAIVIIIGGTLLYQTIMDTTWQGYRGMPIARMSTKIAPSESGVSPIVKMSPPVIGTMIVALLGVGWRMLAISGATDTSSLLPAMCEMTANTGVWVPIDNCGEHQRGRLTREFGAGYYYADCDVSGDWQWGWLKTDLTQRCGFRTRDAESLRNRLTGRTIVFVGDVVVRSLYDALRRALGELTAGEFDTSASDHADVSIVLGDTRLEYKWAPLAFDQVSKLKTLRATGTSSGTKPDLIVTGGGMLDRLHVWATDEDQESHKKAVSKLASELQALQIAMIPTVWSTPTTINTQALSNDEKRTQMNEFAIEEMRKLYAAMNIEDSASFVLRGPAYSSGRVAESYDGVLYPLSVYDAGIQILANSLDWLLDNDVTRSSEPFVPPPVGGMGNPFLGLMMICFSGIGLLFFDGYFGFSYLSSLLVRKNLRRKSGMRQSSGITLPNDLYEEAFSPYHEKLKLPSVANTTPGGRRRSSQRHPQPMDPSEILSLLENESPVSDSSAKVKRRGMRNDPDERSDSSSLPRSMG